MTAPIDLTNAPSLNVDEALSLLAHDMRTSLTIIRGFAAHLDAHRDRMNEADVRASLSAILISTEGLLGFSEDLIDMARAEAGRLEIHRELLSIVSVLEPVLHVARTTHPDHTFVFETNGAATHVYIDSRRIAQVVTNLLDNAAKSSALGTKVTLTVRSHGDSVEVTVRDQGPGIPEDLRPHLFEKFPPNSDGRASSVGLGLYLCRLLVEAHGGSICVGRVTTGSEFGFTLPLRVDLPI